MHPGAYEVYMEYVDDKVSIETTDREFVVEAIRTFFSGKHQELYERLAKEPFAVESLGFWKRLKRIFS
jgi:hypothetical protein